MSSVLALPKASSAAVADAALYTVRRLNAADAEPFRALRLKLVRHYGSELTGLYEEERKKPAEHWVQQCTETADKCFFGSFANDKLVGIMGARKWEGPTSGAKSSSANDNSALWFSAFVEEAHRGHTEPLYQLREDWSKARGFDRAVFYIRDEKERSAQIHEKNGAQYMYTEVVQYPNCPPVPWRWYEKHLQP